MAITFKIAPLVSSGSVPLASEMAGLANAINSRLISGLADSTKRIHQYCFNLTRQIRNPSSDGTTFPSLGEFPMYYQMLDFDTTPSTWPLAQAGDFEGANVAAPANQFVFGIGNEEQGTAGEGDYFTAYDFFSLGADRSPLAHWELAKHQRGAYDPDTGNQYTPMFDLSQRHFRLVFPDWSRHHKSPGGYLPTLEQGSECRVTNVITGEHYTVDNWIYKFHPITEGYLPYTGSGTCGLDFNLDDEWQITGGSPTDIYYVANYPFAWYVYQYDGNVYRFDKTNYILVRDGGGILSRDDGGQIERLMMHPYISEFRGTELQRAQTCFETPYIEYAFANQDFYTKQYQLAPAYAITDTDTLVATYPTHTWTTSQIAGDNIELSNIPDGFRLGGHLVQQRNLSQDVSMRILCDDVPIHYFTCSVSKGSMVEIFDNGPITGSIKYEVTSPLTFTDSNGFLKVEYSLLMDYKPEIWDGYALIRAASGKGAIGDNQMDTRGMDFEYSRQIYDTYANYGCFINQYNASGIEQQVSSVNTNPVFDSMRKYVNSFIRTINGTDLRIPNRPMIVGYEVSQSYHEPDITSSFSILYFNRYQAGLGLNTNNIDCFAGIANTNKSENGIVTSAPYQGYTNEWLLELCGKPYHPSENSLWKPSVYANYFPYINRCHLRPNEFEVGNQHGKDMFRFFQENTNVSSGELRNKLFFPEGLSAYTYAYGKGARQQFNKVNYNPEDEGEVDIATWFYKSCQVYPKPYVITSVTVDDNDIVKVILDRRLDHCEGYAPDGVIENNVSSWNYGDVQAEPYRTDENIVRLFLLKMYNEDNNPQAKTGDNSANSWLQTEADNPYASIYPTFFFTKLIPKPYSNDGIEENDTLDYSGSIPQASHLQLCETYIRAICEGYVDTTLSINQACSTEFNTDYDYTYTNLCMDAFGKPVVSAITGSIRSDYPRTYGPLPDMVMNPQIFNQLALMVNKLTKVRLPLPYRLLVKTKQYEATEIITPDWPSEESSCNRTGFDRMVKHGFVPPQANVLVSESEFESSTYVQAYTMMQISCNGSNYEAKTIRSTVEFQFDTEDPLAWNALNSDLRQIASGSTQTAAVFVSRTNAYHTVDLVQQSEPVPGCSDQGNWFQDPETGLYWTDVGEYINNTDCTYMNTGMELDAGELPASDIIAASVPTPAVGGVELCDSVPYRYRDINVQNTRQMILDVPTEN